MVEQAKHRVVFMGTPEFALPVLEALARDFELAGVVTQRDKPAGRGRQMTPSPAKVWAQERGLAVLTPKTLRDPAAQAQVAELSPEVIVVAAFGLLLPKAVLDLPTRGCVNVHASLLPAYRGAAPIAAAILNGDPVTGVTLMQMEEGLDSGPILAQERIPVLPDDTTATLSARLARLGADMISTILPRWLAGQVTPQPQDDSLATLAPKIEKEQGQIDWSRPAAEIDRRIRAFTPWPGAFTRWQAKILRLLAARPLPQAVSSAPGTVIKTAEGIGVATGEGLLHLIQIQLEGKRAMSAPDFARGQPAWIGSMLGE